MSVGERIEQPIPHPRRLGEVARTIVDVLHEHDIKGQFFKRRHARVEFEVNGYALVYRFACTPSSPSWDSKLARRRLTLMIAEAQMCPHASSLPKEPAQALVRVLLR